MSASKEILGSSIELCFKNWQKLFLDGELGFFEKLGENTLPLPIEYRRLHASARTLLVFSLIAQRRPEYLRTAHLTFEFLKRHACSDNANFVYKVTPEGKHLDTARDAYGYAFVLYALATYYDLTRESSLIAWALRIDEACEKTFFNGSFYRTRVTEDGEDLIGGLNQNHHMHLFEAFSELYRVSQEPRFLQRADRILSLFTENFHHDGAVLESLAGDAAEVSELSFVEPGHVYEWSWLILRFSEYADRPSLLPLAEKLADWGNSYGCDPNFGGVYDRVSVNGKPLQLTKRIWPLTEAVKANAKLYQFTGNVKYRSRRDELVAVFRRNYSRADGLWTEHLNRDLSICSAELPITTLYHLVLCVLELDPGLLKLPSVPTPRKS